MSDAASMDLASLKVADLKRELKARGLAISGKKEELLERLQLALMGESSADLLEDEEEKAAPAAEETETADAAMAAKKKVTLKRDTPITTEEATPAETAAAQEKENIADGAPAAKRPLITAPGESGSNLKETKVRNRITFDSEPEKKPEATEEKAENGAEVGDKPKKLTDEERAAARAARFGVTSVETKKKERAERFGISDASNGKSGDKPGKIGAAPSVDLETLKKRAERFGTTTSSTVKKAELDEKIKKRMERFGAIDKNEKEVKPKVEVNTGVNSVVQDEALKKRAERFGAAT